MTEMTIKRIKLEKEVNRLEKEIEAVRNGKIITDARKLVIGKMALINAKQQLKMM